MKFTTYPTRKDFTARANGTEQEGVITSDAPGQGCRWCTTEDKKFVKVRKSGTEYYRIASEAGEW